MDDLGIVATHNRYRKGFRLPGHVFCQGREQSLPGFDENEFAEASKANARSWKTMIEEFISLRQTSRLMFGGFDEQQLAQTGTANNQTLGVLAAGFIIIGHLSHHVQILKERYL